MYVLVYWLEQAPFIIMKQSAEYFINFMALRITNTTTRDFAFPGTSHSHHTLKTYACVIIIYNS